MSYITRNANIILLFLILLAATGMVGATAYFQTRFDNINDEYTAKLEQLENVSRQVQVYQGLLTSTKEELQLKGSREDELTDKFTTLKDEADTLSDEREGLIQDKRTLETALSEKSRQLVTAQTNLLQKEARVTELTSELFSCDERVDDLEDEVDDLDDMVDCLESTPDPAESGC